MSLVIKLSILRSWSGLILGACSFRNEYDGHTIEKTLDVYKRQDYNSDMLIVDRDNYQFIIILSGSDSLQNKGYGEKMCIRDRASCRRCGVSTGWLSRSECQHSAHSRRLIGCIVQGS